MERPQLGNGVEVSRLILGCGNFGGIGSAPEFFGRGESDDEAFALMDVAWELGVTTFDTADIPRSRLSSNAGQMTTGSRSAKRTRAVKRSLRQKSIPVR